MRVRIKEMIFRGIMKGMINSIMHKMKILTLIKKIRNLPLITDLDKVENYSLRIKCIPLSTELKY